MCFSFFWRALRHARSDILLPAVAIAAYHLTPLSGMDRIFWLFPDSQLLPSPFIGLVWGYACTKRDYETAVLCHTLSNWIPFMSFRAA